MKGIKERSVALPDTVTVLKIDYDNDRQMKARHNVITQHTMIRLKRWF